MKTIMDLTKNEVARVYSGRPGCGCGCRGVYYSDPRNITRVLNAIKRQAADPQVNNEIRIGLKDGIAFLETDTRYYWAYLK